MNVPSLLAAVDVNQLWESVRLQSTFRQTPWWGWLFFAGMIFVGLASAKVISLIFRAAGDRSLKSGWVRRQIVIQSLSRPLGLIAFTMAALIGIGFLKLDDQMRWFTWQIGKLLLITAAGWALYNLVALVELILLGITSKTKSPLDDQLVPLVRKTLRIMLVVTLSLFVADNVFQADIKSFLAGLGIIGLAISLASQDTVKNFFGSVTIFVDQPFNLGDRVLLAGHEGVVEEIGFRSTKLRTPTGNVVQIPNSKIVDSTVENVTRRRNIRRNMAISITYDTPPEKVARAVAILREVLNDPEVCKAFDMEKLPPRVAFEELAGSSLNIRVMYWFHPGTDYWAYMAHAEQINLTLLRRFNDEKIDFAFPTQTLYIAGDAGRAPVSMRSMADNATRESDTSGLHE